MSFYAVGDDQTRPLWSFFFEEHCAIIPEKSVICSNATSSCWEMDFKLSENGLITLFRLVGRNNCLCKATADVFLKRNHSIRHLNPLQTAVFYSQMLPWLKQRPSL